MKTYVDQDTCIGCGLCTSTCPEVYSMGDEGKAYATKEQVSAECADGVEEAADGCPVSAIQIEK